jgi:hypothetical protein
MKEEHKNIADKIVSLLKEKNGGPISDKQIDKEISGKEIIGGQYGTKPILDILVAKQILLVDDAQYNTMGLPVRLTTYTLAPNGWNYIGYDNLLELENIEKQRKERKEDIDFKNAKRVYDTYNSTRIIAWVTFVIAILLALLKIAEALKIWPYNLIHTTP